MYPVSNDVKALFDAEQRQVLRITGTDRNGTAISITDANVMEGGFEIDRYSCNGEKLEIGTAIASELTLRLDNREGQFNDTVFEGTELFVEIGIADWDQENPEITYIPCGYFISDEQPRRLSTITIHALDRMVKFDLAYPVMQPLQDGRGNTLQDGRGNTLYIMTGFQMPMTVAEIVAAACSFAGVTCSQDLSGLPNSSMVITAMPDLQQTYSLRSIIQWCAGLMGTNAWMDWNGELRFNWYDQTTGYVADKTNRFSSDLYENNILVTGLSYTNPNGKSASVGLDAYALDLTGNYLAAGRAANVLNALSASMIGFTYRPFSATVIAAPYLWPMDVISLVDSENNSVNCIVTNVHFSLNGTTALQGCGSTAQVNSTSAQSSVTVEQGRLIEQATIAMGESVADTLTQEEIFNILTNGGVDQGLILYNGKVYLNASYIRAGEISARIITAGRLKSEDGSTYFDLDLSTVTTTDGPRRVSLHGGRLEFWYDDSGSTSLPKMIVFSGNSQTDSAILRTYVAGLRMLLQSEFELQTGAYMRMRVNEDGVYLYGDIYTSENMGATEYKGISTTFTTSDGRTVTVRRGMIVGIS